MKEKKLTDEEIVKDIERSTGMPSYWKKIVIDLIHRQKAEIERLTEENGWLSKECNKTTIECAELQKQVADLTKELFTEKRSHSTMAIYEIELKKADKENAELQKQVDELTAFKNEVISTSLYVVGRRDGKAVANDIWIDITSYYFALRVLGNATVEIDKLAEFWHKYGVEVE